MKRAVLLPLLASLLLGVAYAQEREPSECFTQIPLGIQVYRDLAYVPDGHERHNLDLYVPETREGSLPLIVWIHGGGWKQGSKDHCLPLSWVEKGYAVASINYRLSQDAKFPAQIEDCKAAICWLRAHAEKFKIDRNRMAAWGDSAGGHLASLLGTAGDFAEWERGYPASSSRVQAVIDWYGRADLRAVSTDPALADSPSALLLGGSGDAVAELAQKASPILHVSEDDPPFLIMHGEKDKVVPLEQSEAFAETLKEAKVPATLVVLKGAGHGGQEFLQPEQVKVIDTFLSEHLCSQRIVKPHE